MAGVPVNVAKLVTDRLAVLGIDPPTGAIPTMIDAADVVHVGRCTGPVKQQPCTPGPAQTLPDLAQLPGRRRSCSCLSSPLGAGPLLDAFAVPDWVRPVYRFDADICAIERVAARTDAPAQTRRRARVYAAQTLADLRTRQLPDPTARTILDALTARCEAAQATLTAGLDPSAAAELVASIRFEARARGPLDETLMLVRLDGRGAASSALVFSAIDLWDVAGDDDRTVLEMPAWAVPWMCAECMHRGVMVQLASFDTADSPDVRRVAARLAGDATFAVLRDAVDAARLVAAAR